jgi:hypothetical protein
MTTKEIIDNWLNEIQTDLIKNYDRLGLRASGNWANKLEQFQNQDGNLIKLGILGEKYTGAIEFGRLPTKMGSIPGKLKGIIRKWIDVKGITPRDGISKDSLAFLITRKIHREGWKVPNRFNAGGLVSDVITKSRISELMKKLSLYYIEEIKTDLKNTLENGSNSA